MAKKKEPENFSEITNRLTGEAIVSLGRGTPFRDIISGVISASAMWHESWTEYKNMKKNADDFF